MLSILYNDCSLSKQCCSISICQSVTTITSSFKWCWLSYCVISSQQFAINVKKNHVYRAGVQLLNNMPPQAEVNRVHPATAKNIVKWHQLCDQESDWLLPIPSACTPQSLSVASLSWRAWKHSEVSWRVVTMSDMSPKTTLIEMQTMETLPQQPVQQRGVAVVTWPDYNGCQQMTSGDVLKQMPMAGYNRKQVNLKNKSSIGHISLLEVLELHKMFSVFILDRTAALIRIFMPK